MMAQDRSFHMPYDLSLTYLRTNRYNYKLALSYASANITWRIRIRNCKHRTLTFQVRLVSTHEVLYAMCSGWGHLETTHSSVKWYLQEWSTPNRTTTEQSRLLTITATTTRLLRAPHEIWMKWRMNERAMLQGRMQRGKWTWHLTSPVIRLSGMSR